MGDSHYQWETFAWIYLIETSKHDIDKHIQRIHYLPES